MREEETISRNNLTTIITTNDNTQRPPAPCAIDHAPNPGMLMMNRAKNFCMASVAPETEQRTNTGRLVP